MAIAVKASRRTWGRMALSVFGIAIIALNWRWGVGHLYTLPPHAIAAFTSMTNNESYVIGAIVVFMVTGKLVYDWKNKTEAVTTVVSKVSEQVAHIIEEGQPGAPIVRPWSQDATEE